MKLKLWRIILWLVLFYAIQHTVRDVLSDVFEVQNAFTQFSHREASHAAWCSNYCRWTIFPIEVFYIISSVYLLRKNEFGWLGWLMLILAIPILFQYFDIFIK